MIRYCKYENCKRVLLRYGFECSKCERRRLRNGLGPDGTPAYVGKREARARQEATLKIRRLVQWAIDAILHDRHRPPRKITKGIVGYHYKRGPFWGGTVANKPRGKMRDRLL